MSDMNGVINTQSDGKDNIDAGYDVNSKVPEVKEPDDVDQSKDHSQKNHQTNP